MELHCRCTISGNCAQVGCLQISPGIFASSVDISSSQKWVRSCFIQKRSVSLNAHSGVRTAWIPSLHSKKTRRRMLAEVNNGLQQQEGQPEECLEEEVHFIEGKLLSELSTWGIGGPAKYFYEFHDEAHLIAALREGFTGLEFASGIPGTVGGAVFMNSGADGQDTAGALKSVEIVTVDGRRKVFDRIDLAFSYRKSPFQAMQNFAAIVAATFELTPSSSAQQRQKAYLKRRKKTQPIGERSVGCVFRNPMSGHSAGTIIEQAGLKGVMLGGAKVSEMHANFLINVGSSSSTEMCALIELVKEQVRQKLGIELEEEILYVPYN